MQINNFPEKTLLDANDSIPIQQADGITKRVSRDNLFTGITSSAGEYPTSFTHWHDESIIVAGNSLQIDTNASIAYSAEIYQTPPGNGDKFSFKKLLAAGNYKINVLTVRSTNVARLRLDINNIMASDNIDCYSPSLIINAVLSRNITIPADGLHDFLWTIDGKNSASTNYYFSGRKFWAYKI